MRRVLLSLLAIGLLSLFPSSAGMLPQIVWNGQTASPSPCSSSAPDSWSPTYFFGAGGGSPYVSITGGGLTSQVAAAGSNHQVTEIGQCLHSTGQLYIELTTITVPGSDLGFGFAAVTKDNQRTLGDLQLVGATPDSVGYQFFGSSRKWKYNNTFGSLVNLPLPANGDVIGLAVDFDLKKLWIRNSTVSCGTWYGSNTSSADPSTGTNGYDFSSPAPAGLPWAVAWASNFNGGTTEGATMNPAGPFLCTAPTPFNPWQSASIKFDRRYHAAEPANDNFVRRDLKIAA